MASTVEYALILDELDSEVQAAHKLDPQFFYKIVTLACTRLPLLNKLGFLNALPNLALGSTQY